MDNKHAFFSRELVKKAIMTTAEETLVRQRTCPNCGSTLRGVGDDHSAAHGMRFRACEDCARMFVLEAEGEER